MIFVKERTKIVADMGSTVAIGEVGKEMGRMWGLMDQHEKKYEDAFKQDKARYDEERKKCQPCQGFLDTKVRHRHDDIKAEIAMGKYLEENYFRKPWFNILRLLFVFLVGNVFFYF